MRGGYTPLQTAVIKGFYEVVDLLCSEGASTESTNNQGKTSLHIICGNSQLAETTSAKICKLLVEKHNANVEATDGDEWTPLFYCR